MGWPTISTSFADIRSRKALRPGWLDAALRAAGVRIQAGVAASVLTFLRMVIGSAGGALVGLAYDGTTRPLAAAAAAASACGAGLGAAGAGAAEAILGSY